MNDLARDLTLYAVLLIALGVLAGCGGDAETPIPTAPAPPPPEPAPPPPEPTPEPPATPTGLMVSGATETSITWTWNAVEGATGYVVQANTDEMWDDTDTVIFTVGGAMVPFTTETTYTASDLEAGTTMYVRVAAAAVDAPLVSAFSTHVTGMAAAPPPEPAPPPPEPDRSHCQGGFGYIENVLVLDRGRDWVTYGWDDNECLDEYDTKLWKGHHRLSESRQCLNCLFRERRVQEPEVTFRDLPEGVYWFDVYLNPGDNPLGYYGRMEWLPRVERYELLYENLRPVSCSGGTRRDARDFFGGPVLLDEWDRTRAPFVLNVSRSLDRAEHFDADLLLEHAADAVGRFNEVLGETVLAFGRTVNRDARVSGEILVVHGQHPSDAHARAYAEPDRGIVAFQGNADDVGPNDLNYEEQSDTLYHALLHEIFHLFGFKHAEGEFFFFSGTDPADPGVPMTVAFSHLGGTDTLQDFAALRCVLGL